MSAADAQQGPTLIKLSNTDREVANPDEDVKGRSVIDTSDEKLGKVADLLVDDAASHVRFLLVEHGGILGIGATESYIPVEAITEVTEDAVRVNTDLTTLAGAPVYDPEIGNEAGFYSDTYGYYGVTPYWSAGYVAPGFPYFGQRDGFGRD